MKVKSILQEKLNLKKEDIKDIRRIPRERQENKVRPIRIIFNHLEKRSEALKLRNIFYKTNETEENNQIFISIDRTRQEQETHKDLVKELKRRKVAGEQNLYIRNGRILTFLPFRMDPQQYWG